MRALGFNVVRLILNWSEIEPSPGRHHAAYLDRIAQVVGWAGAQGIQVILDMHLDQYSRYILPVRSATPSGCTPSGGSDGAPAWAVFTDGKPACAFLGQGALNPAALAAFQEFRNNHPVTGPSGGAAGTGLQDQCIGAIEALTGVHDGMATCASASQAHTGGCAYPSLADVTRQQILFEPLADRNITDFSLRVSTPFSEYPNLVFTPHNYTHAFTADTFIGYPLASSPYPPCHTFGYQTPEYEAQAMHAAVFVSELGDNAGSDAVVPAGETAAQDATMTGSPVWAWKGITSDPCCVCDPATGAFSMQVERSGESAGVTAGARAAETVVWIPPGNGGCVSVGGRASLDGVVIQPDAGRLVCVRPLAGCSGTRCSASRFVTNDVEVGSPSSADVAALSAGERLEPISGP